MFSVLEANSLLEHERHPLPPLWLAGSRSQLHFLCYFALQSHMWQFSNVLSFSDVLVLLPFSSCLPLLNPTFFFHSKSGYWPSYNIPFHEKVYNLSGYPMLVQRLGLDYSYDLTPRAKIFRRDQGTVTDLASMKYIMRYNST